MICASSSPATRRPGLPPPCVRLLQVRLGLVAARLPAAARLLELPALRRRTEHARRGGAVGNAGRLAEVALRLAPLQRAAQEHRALPKGRAKSHLVERDALAAGLDDA